MNILDIVTVAIILICVIICYVKGLLMSIFNLLSLVASFFLTRELYPHVSAFLKGTPLFTSLSQIVTGWLGQGTGVPDTGQVVSDTVNGMSLPEIFKNLVLSNMDSIPDLDLTSVYEYVADFAAGLAIDAIAILAVFIAAFLIMRIIGMLLKVVSRMPVIKTFNRLGGGVMGFIIGSLISWLALSVMSGLFAASADFPVTDLLAESLIARYFLFNL